MLIKTILEFIQSKNVEQKKAQLLNIGAGTSNVIEDYLSASKKSFICDRLDIVDSKINHQNVGKIFIASVEHIPMIENNSYDAVFANYLFEHVNDLSSAATELYRILKPNGYLIFSVPNVKAPEFLISRMTPTWFHTFIRGKPGHEIAYSYKNIKQLRQIFEAQGFKIKKINQYSFTYGYLYRFPIVNVLSRFYDKLVNLLHLTPLMGDACLIFIK